MNLLHTAAPLRRYARIRLAQLRFTQIHVLLGWLALWISSGHNCSAQQEITQQLAPTGTPDLALREDLDFFESQVRPLLVEHCYACHSTRATKLQAGLRLDSRQELLRGGDSGPSVIPGNASESLLIQAVHYENYEMPPKGKLSPSQIEILERWVERGAAWPAEIETEATSTAAQFDLQQRASQHWAWQPITVPALPEIRDRSWPVSEIDHFILARLEAAELKPAADAQRWVLLRRLCFDLLGLPPTTEQYARFMNDEGPQAVPRLVDELLQSPHFGERWGRHWLDLVRYAESRGHEFDDNTENAFQYRDYIIRALNADVPYDQLIREHIAGDLLNEPRLNPAAGFNESILGTGFWFLGEWVHSPVDIRKDESDRFDNMIDVMSKAFLGLTVACARCHDHKFDAISTADYYALSGFLQSSDFRQVRFESLEHNRLIAQQLKQLDDDFRQQISHLLPAPTTANSCNTLPPDVAARMAVDYTTDPGVAFLQDGFVFGAGPSRAGEPRIAGTSQQPQLAFTSRTAASSDPFWKGLRSITQPDGPSRSALSKIPRSGRTLRTPTFELTQPTLACRVRGSGHIVACVDSHRLVAGPLHGETVVKIAADQSWTQLKLGRYVGHRLHLEFTPDEDCQLEVACVIQGSESQILQSFEAFEQQQAQQVQVHEQACAERLQSDPQLAEQIQHLLIQWSQQRQVLQSQVKLESRLAMAMLDGTAEDDHILIRGNSSNPGPLEPRHFLTALDGNQTLAVASGSGRLELAERINDAANPLTARVIVNRLWHHLLGRGIVPTTDDFGVLGQAPSDPLLLDYLASQFLQNGRSLKSAIRSIVLSRTYQMSDAYAPSALQLDPNNELWHYRPPKRLEGEAIRDALLAASDQLDRTQFGPSIPVHLTPFMDGRGRPAASGPLDGASRRSIYGAVRRNFLSPFLLTFDTPQPFSCMGRRNSSNVPAQALILMNDPFVVQQTAHWAERAVERYLSISTPDALHTTVEWLYVTGLSRTPGPLEQQAAVDFLTQQAEERGLPLSTLEVWQDLAHALVNTKEFIFLR